MNRTDWQQLAAIVGRQNVSTEPDDLTKHSYDWWPMATKWRNQGKSPLRPEQ